MERNDILTKLQTKVINENELFSVIDEYLEKFQYEKAEALITVFIDKYPSNLDYREKRIEIIEALDSDYVHYCNGAVDEWSYMLLPEKYVNYHTLIDDYTKMLEVYQTPDLYINRARIYGMTGNRQLKINDLKSAIFLNPNLFKCYIELAKTYDDDEKALYYYSQAIDKSMYNIDISSQEIEDAYYSRSFLYAKLKNYKSALEDLKYLKNKNNDYFHACKVFIKYAFLCQNYDDAYSIIIEKNMKDYFLIPYVYKKLGNKKLQIDYYKNLLKNKRKLGEKQKNYLQAYKRLIILQNRKHLNPILSCRYFIDKTVLSPILKIIYNIKDFIDFCNADYIV